MKHPWHYRGLKRRAGFFLLRHSLLTTRQWREVLLSQSSSSVDRTPRTHEEFMAANRISAPERNYTRKQLEDIVLRSPTWRRPCPTIDAAVAANVLATAGVIGGPSSKLGATREEALRLLRRRLSPRDMAAVEVTLLDYNASGPHPRYIFGSGWSADDDFGRGLARAEVDREEGRETEHEWMAKRRSQWHLRLIDRLFYWKQFAFALSLPRWYREFRYGYLKPHRLIA